jgi:hypothetical protein
MPHLAATIKGESAFDGQTCPSPARGKRWREAPVEGKAQDCKGFPSRKQAERVQTIKLSMSMRWPSGIGTGL